MEEGKPKWLKDEPTRKKSGKQEKKIAKDIGGRLFSNSGAKFGENDLFNETLEIEAKITKHSQYTLKVSELQAMRKKCRAGRIPVEVIEFGNGESYAVINYLDFLEFVK